MAATRVVDAVSSSETLIVLSRPTRTGPVVASKTPGLELSVLGPHDADEYARVVGTDSPRSWRARLSDTTVCYAVRLDGGLVHTSWVTTGCAWTREVGASFCVSPPDAYVYESFTHPGARGKGIYPFALGGICKRLADRGVEVLWVAVESANVASLRAVAKAGFAESFRIAYRRRLGRLRVDLPQRVKTDTTAGLARKKRRVWLSGDGAEKQWKP